MPFRLFYDLGTAANAINMLMQKEIMIVRIPDAELWFKKSSIKKSR